MNGSEFTQWWGGELLLEWRDHKVGRTIGWNSATVSGGRHDEVTVSRKRWGKWQSFTVAAPTMTEAEWKACVAIGVRGW